MKLVASNPNGVKQNFKFLLFSTLILLLIFILENINGRFWLSDFKVYYSAATAFCSGEPVYGVPFGEDTGLYKYSPVLLFLFGPASFLPYSLAAGIHFFLSAFAAVAAVIVVQSILTEFLMPVKGKQNELFLIISFITVLNHLFRELHLGNVNMLLVLALSLALRQILHAKQISAGILFGVTVLFKPYFILIALPLLFHKKFSAVVVAGMTVVIAIVLMILFSGVDKTLSLHQQWITSMGDHSTLLASSNTIGSLLEHYFSATLPVSFQLYLLLFVTLLYFSVSFYLRHKRPASHNGKNNLLILFYFVLLALIPNLLITDTEHFLFSLPLIILCMNLVWFGKNIALISFFIFFSLLYAANLPELFGSELSDKIYNAGVLGIANLGIIILTLCAFFLDNRGSAVLDADAKGVSQS